VKVTPGGPEPLRMSFGGGVLLEQPQVRTEAEASIAG
jgi:hypothetical protein